MPARSKRLVEQQLMTDLVAASPQTFWGLPPERLAGIDEAGRGCLAGPVVAAAVILPKHTDLAGLADSKTLSASRRAGLAAAIGAQAVAWGIGVVWPVEIDRINILQATLKAMCHAASVLRVRPEGLLIDGNQTIPAPLFQRFQERWTTLPRQQSLIQGDALVPAISAASIIAKTFRDSLMDALDRRYPGYGFAKHKGYGSQEHYAALRKLGASAMHRLTFRGVVQEEIKQVQGFLL